MMHITSKLSVQQQVKMEGTHASWTPRRERIPRLATPRSFLY